MAKRKSNKITDSSLSTPVPTGRAGRKVKISLRLPPPLFDELLDAMARDEYSPKKKSVWIEESLLAMTRHDPDFSESLVGDRAQGPNQKQMIVVLSSEARQQLRDGIIRLRLQVPTIEGVQSLVIRCAIRFRIRHPECFTTLS